MSIRRERERETDGEVRQRGRLVSAVLAVNTNALVQARLLDVTWVRVQQRHHLPCNNNNNNNHYCYTQ